MSANRRYRSAAAETGCVHSVIAVADRTSAKRCLHHGTHVASTSPPAMLLLTLPGPPCRRYPTNIAPAIATCTSSARGSGVRTKRHRRTDRGHPQRFSTTTTGGLASRSESRLDLLTGGALMAQTTPSPAATGCGDQRRHCEVVLTHALRPGLNTLGLGPQRVIRATY